MKAEEILKALDHIPQEYIAEAKPGQRGESRTEQHSAAANIVRRSARSSTRKDSIMSTKQPIWQRVTTGIVAAAACTVFVGGGVFIAQQAMERDAQQAMQSETEQDLRLETNFLGGSGQIYVSNDNMTLMYDDDYVYLLGGYYRAERNGGTVTALVTEDEYLDAETREMLPNVCWDGETFYCAKGTSIYRMDCTGKCEDEPFYTISEQSLHEIENNMTDYTIHLYCVKKLADGYYVINYFATSDEGGYKAFGYVYQPETGEQVTVPQGSVLGEYLSDGGNIYYTPAGANGALFEVRLDNTWTHKIHVNLHALTGNSWLIDDGNVYYMSTLESSYNFVERYSKFDLETHTVTQVLDKAPFSEFRDYEGDIYAVQNNKELICSDPEWTSPETLFTFDGTMPEAAQTWVENDDGSRKQLCIANAVLGVDGSYILVSMPQERYALYDRETGEMRYFYAAQPGEETEPSAETNCFGGTGEIRPVDWDVYSMTALYRDDEYYYYDPADDSVYSDSVDADWLRCPIAGGTWEAVPVESAAKIRLLSDGEQIHFERNAYPVDTQNYAESHGIPCGERMTFDFFELFREAECVTAATDQFVYKTWHIWHIRDRYFVVGGWWDNGRIRQDALDPYGAHGTFTAWFDEMANPLETQIIDNELRVDGAYFCDAEQENMYLTWNGTVSVLQTPGYPLADYTAPDSDMPVNAACVTDGTTYFFTAQALCAADADGNVTVLDEAYTVGPMPYLMPDGSLCYVKYEGEQALGWGVYQLRPESGTAILLSNTGSLESSVCGIAENPDAPLGYEVVYRTLQRDLLSSAMPDMPVGTFGFIDLGTIAVTHELCAP